MAGRLEGKVCVITGAGGGMGREAAIVFTGEGAQVCVADVELELAEETVALCAADSAFAVQANVADEDDVKAMYAATAERFGGIDVLYNNAGISPDDDDSILVTRSRPGSGSRTSTRRASSSAASTGSRTCSSAAAAR